MKLKTKKRIICIITALAIAINVAIPANAYASNILAVHKGTYRPTGGTDYNVLIATSTISAKVGNYAHIPRNPDGSNIVYFPSNFIETLYFFPLATPDNNNNLYVTYGRFVRHNINGTTTTVIQNVHFSAGYLNTANPRAVRIPTRTSQGVLGTATYTKV